MRNMNRHCVCRAEYRVVMKTSLESGSWNVGEELLIRDSWNDLLGSMTLSDGSGEAMEYFRINYAILDNQLIRYSDRWNKGWNTIEYDDSD